MVNLNAPMILGLLSMSMGTWRGYWHRCFVRNWSSYPGFWHYLQDYVGLAPCHPSVFPQVLPLHFQMPPATRFTFSCQIPTWTGTVLVLFSNNHSDDLIYTQATERTMYPGGTIHIWSDFCQILPWPIPSSLPQHGPCRRRSTCSGRAAGSRSAWWSSCGIVLHDVTAKDAHSMVKISVNHLYCLYYIMVYYIWTHIYIYKYIYICMVCLRYSLTIGKGL